MAFSFNMKLNDVSSAIEKAKNAVKSNDGSFDGDNSNGSFSAKRVKGNYVITGNEARITITDKPIIYPKNMVEKEIRKFFG